MSNILVIGDLVIIRKELQVIVGIRGVGIITGEVKIISSDVIGYDIGEIDSYNIYFVEIDTLYTVPKACVEKLTVLKE